MLRHPNSTRAGSGPDLHSVMIKPIASELDARTIGSSMAGSASPRDADLRHTENGASFARHPRSGSGDASVTFVSLRVCKSDSIGVLDRPAEAGHYVRVRSRHASGYRMPGSLRQTPSARRHVREGLIGNGTGTALCERLKREIRENCRLNPRTPVHGQCTTQGIWRFSGGRSDPSHSSPSFPYRSATQKIR